jgi:mannonate dehydratase
MGTMIECWRWFGPEDPTKLSDLPQVGAAGVVTALHDYTPGAQWPEQDIVARKAMIEAAGLKWEVVESLPVSEEIKIQGPDMMAHLGSYIASMEALARHGVHTICYNFMPILDWTRTNMRAQQPHGGSAMQFDLVDFAAFDLHILKRSTAVRDYSDAVQAAADAAISVMDEAQKSLLVHTVVSGLPGANDGWTLDDVRLRISTYDGIGAELLRDNLIDFLSEVIPTAERLGLRLCCHPDDPPFSLLGLPRVMSSQQDYKQVINAVDTIANGVTLCTGSLGVNADFDAAEFVHCFGPKIHFAHLRNTKRLLSPDPSRPHFFESAHLEGDTDMVVTIAALMMEEKRRRLEGRSDHAIPMRPDHGQELLGDQDNSSLPGYPLIGRMRGLAELRGIMAAVGVLT